MFHKKSVIGVGTIEFTFIKTSPALLNRPNGLMTDHFSSFAPEKCLALEGIKSGFLGLAESIPL